MRNRILGAIGVLWGGGILVSRVLRDSSSNGEGAYATGQAAGLVMGLLLFLAGLYYLVKSFRKSE